MINILRLHKKIKDLKYYVIYKYVNIRYLILNCQKIPIHYMVLLGLII